LYRSFSPLCVLISIFFAKPMFAQQPKVEVVPQFKDHKIMIRIDKKFFAEFLYPDTLEKPVLFSIHAPGGQLVTRGFPLLPRTDEPTDHPHHVGLWFNYENVNGLDFWNNSYAIPAEKKKGYGWIKTDSILEMKSGEEGKLTYSGHWENQSGEILLHEKTTFNFRADQGLYSIDRITQLIALQDISFPDTKDGLLGLRVAHELELPSAQPKQYTDSHGNITKVAVDPSVSGNYLSSEGKAGDSAWGTRGRWCMMYGKMSGDSISIVIIDHPSNPGYPTYWHARGYGLFAANPLGEKVFSNGKENLNFKLKKGETVTFRYRIVIASGKRKLDPQAIDQMADAFAHSK